MILLAEIADKMYTIPELWVYPAANAIVLAVIGLIHRWIALMVFILGTLFSALLMYGAVFDAFIDPTFSFAIQKEMGTLWTVNSISSTLSPAALTAAILWWHWNRKAKTNKLANQPNDLGRSDNDSTVQQGTPAVVKRPKTCRLTTAKCKRWADKYIKGRGSLD